MLFLPEFDNIGKVIEIEVMSVNSRT